MEKLKAASLFSCDPHFPLIFLPQITEVRRATIASASKRATEAERTAHNLEPLLKEKTDIERDLQKRLDLSRQRSQATKSLVTTLQKLDEAQTKLKVATEKADRFDKRIQSLRAETDAFESKYEIAQKEYNKMLLELEHLEFN